LAVLIYFSNDPSALGLSCSDSLIITQGGASCGY